jgi:isopentenyldiphosphate isomerase
VAGRIAVVDDANRFVRWEERRVIHDQRLVHRSAYVLVFDSAARLLVQRRHRDKQTYPRHWDVSCAGHVEESDYLAGPDDDLDDVYAAVAARELHEELGVAVAVTPVERFGPRPGVHYEWIQLFTARSDGPFRLQADEVEEYRLFDRAQIARLLASGEPVTQSLRWLAGQLLDGGRWPDGPA